MNKTELGLIGGIGSFVVLGTLYYLQYSKKINNNDHDNNNSITPITPIIPISFNSQYWPHLPLHPENMKAPIERDRNGKIVKGLFTHDDPFPLSPSINRNPDLLYDHEYVSSTLYGKDIGTGLGTGKGSKRKYKKNKRKSKKKK